MIPDELEQFVDNNSAQAHSQKYFKHILDSLICWFVDNVLLGTFIDKIQYFLCGNHSICMTDPPLILLQVRFTFDVTHYSHMRFGYNQIRCSFKIEHFKYFVSGLTVIDSHEECGIYLCINCTL